MNATTMGSWMGIAVLCMGTVGNGGLACTATGPVDIGAGIIIDLTKGLFGVNLTYSRRGDTLTFTNGGDEPLSGCLIFTDKDGNEVGRFSGTIGPNSSITLPIPPGTTNVRSTDDKDCGEDEKEKDKSQTGDGHDPVPGGGSDRFAGAADPLLPEAASWRTYRSVTLDPDLTGGPNIDHCLQVRALSSAAAATMVESIERHGLTAPLPTVRGVAEVDVRYYCETSFDPILGGVTMTLAENDAFESIEVFVNGVLVATLDDGVAVPNDAGWEARRFALARELFDYDSAPGATWGNEYEIRYRVEGQTSEVVGSGHVVFENEP